MDILLPILLFVVGMAVLIKGADFLVDGASSLAKSMGVSEIVIGLTVVAFGTSMPELIVNIFASAQGHADVAYGNVIGSNMGNILLILGISGLIYPLSVKRNTAIKEIPFAILAGIVLFILVNDQLFFKEPLNILSRFDAMILMVFFVIFIFYAFKISKLDFDAESESHKIMPRGKSILFVFLGLAGLVGGGKLVVDNAIVLATFLGISQKLISLTVVAIGTSLPELATSAMAAYRRKSDIAIGNIVGSNIFNLLLILGVSGLIKPLPFDAVFNVDLYIMQIATLILFVFMFVGKKNLLERWQSFLLLLMYIGYTVYLIKRS
jgi:cation:H+ antiporter